MPEWWIYYVRLRPSLEALRRRENPRWILLPAVQEQAAFVLASPDRDAQAKTGLALDRPSIRVLREIN